MIDFIVKYKDITEISIQLLVAVGTIGSVIVSLYLSTKNERLKISSYLQVMVFSQDKETYITVVINNKGLRDVCIEQNSFFVQIKNKKKRHLIFSADMNMFKYPRVIKPYGSETVLLLKQAVFVKMLKDEQITKNNIKKLKLYYRSSIGELIHIKMDKKFIQEIFNSNKDALYS